MALDRCMLLISNASYTCRNVPIKPLGDNKSHGGCGMTNPRATTVKLIYREQDKSEGKLCLGLTLVGNGLSPLLSNIQWIALVGNGLSPLLSRIQWITLIGNSLLPVLLRITWILMDEHHCPDLMYIRTAAIREKADCGLNFHHPRTGMSLESLLRTHD